MRISRDIRTPASKRSHIGTASTVCEITSGAFEIPVATFLLVLSGITTVEALSAKRPYVFLGCFVVGMLVTPPDVISQTVLAVPMWLLFEAGVLISRLIRTSDQD